MAQQAQKVGERIAYEREQKGWTKAELARQMPGTVSGNDIYRWESGKHLPRSDTLDALAELFGIEQADLHAGVPEQIQQKPKNNDFMGQLNEAETAPQLDRIEEALGVLAEGQREVLEAQAELQKLLADVLRRLDSGEWGQEAQDG